MDWTAIIAEIGGGLPAVVIVGLAFACWALWRRVNELTDTAFKREREYSAELSATIRAVEQVARSVGDRS